VAATLAQQFELRGDLSPGAIVDLDGTSGQDGAITAHRVVSACPTAGVIDCATETDPHFELRVEGTTFEVTGRLESVTADAVSVLGPGLVVQISRDAATQVDGALKTGDPVRVEGTVLDNQQLHALTVALRCQAALAATPQPSAAPASPSPPAPTQSPDKNRERCDGGDGGRRALRLEVDDGQVEVKRGVVISTGDNSLTIETPGGLVTVIVDEDTEVKGNLAAALEVRLKGHVQDDGSLLAEEIKVLCRTAEAIAADEDDDDQGDEGRRSEDGQSNEDDRGGGDDGGDNGGRRGEGDDGGEGDG
jgi:hypothetical protein